MRRIGGSLGALFRGGVLICWTWVCTCRWKDLGFEPQSLLPSALVQDVSDATTKSGRMRNCDKLAKMLTNVHRISSM